MLNLQLGDPGQTACKAGLSEQMLNFINIQLIKNTRQFAFEILRIAFDRRFVKDRAMQVKGMFTGKRFRKVCGSFRGSRAAMPVAATMQPE